MLSVLTSLFAGPAVGIFGSVVSGITGYFERKQQMEADAAKYAHETNLLQLQMQARGQELESEERIAAIAADTAAMKASYQHDTGYGETGPIMSGVLRMVRPVLTFALIGLVAVILMADVKGVDMKEIALKVVFLAEVAVSWWFADRRRSRK